jgi:hypothetical protein
MMERVNRRATFLLLLLVLLVAPVANAWCSTVCAAAAITSGCAHGLQVTDDLPVAKTVPVVATHFTWTAVSESAGPLRPVPVAAAVTQHTPLRL